MYKSKKPYRDPQTGMWHIENESTEQFYEELLQKLKTKQNFAFSRWGDGELNAVFGSKRRANCDGHTYFEDMGRELKQILLSQPKYIMGLQPLAMSIAIGDELELFEHHNNLKINWVNSDILHNASIQGQFYKFFQALSDRKVIIVGPSKLSRIDKYIPVHYFLSIPDRDCWLSNKDIESILCSYLNEEPNQVVLFCASMMTEVLIDRLYHKFGDTQTFIDTGSVFDPYCNVRSRSYHKKLKI